MPSIRLKAFAMPTSQSTVTTKDKVERQVNRANERDCQHVNPAAHRIEEGSDQAQANELHHRIRAAQIVVDTEQQHQRRRNQNNQNFRLVGPD